MSKINIIPIFVPHLGCPNDCVFCNQRRITGVQEFSLEESKEKIEEYLDIFKNSSSKKEIAFYGGSFTAINKKLQEDLLEIAFTYKEKKIIDEIRLSTRPDCINEEVIQRLLKYKVDSIELGIQSMDNEVLELSKRGHNKNSVYKAVNLIKAADFKLGLQQMVGLPGDNLDNSLYTTNEIINLNPDFVRIYPTLVIKNTELEDMYLSKIYRPLPLDEAVSIVSELMVKYYKNNINVIRVGLQSTENLQLAKDVVAGPLHDAFRELCESQILFNIIKKEYMKFLGDSSIIIRSDNKTISQLVGQKAVNKSKLKKLFKTDKIKFIGDKSFINQINVTSGNKNLIINIKESIINL